MPDGRQQSSGGWNRVILQVTELPARIVFPQEGGVHFRNEMEVGPGGKTDSTGRSRWQSVGVV
jgi:glyoxylase I family protein